jgi:predicted transposase/invertase (TIGR01784 family)
MALGIDPTVDYAFKKLFGDPENSDLLIHLLNAVLKPDSPIVKVELLNPFNDKEFIEDKLSVLDIKARDALGAWYNVEMQSNASRVLRQRLPYYNSRLFVGQLSEGDGYELLAPAITVCFLDDVLFTGVESPHLTFTLCDCGRKV